MADQAIAFAESSPLSVNETLASTIAGIRANRRKYASKTRADWLAQEVVDVCVTSAPAGTRLLETVTSMEDFEDANEARFYMLRYRDDLFKFTLNGLEASVYEATLVEYVRSGVIAKLCEIAGLEVDSVIVLQTKSQLDRKSVV